MTTKKRSQRTTKKTAHPLDAAAGYAPPGDLSPEDQDGGVAIMVGSAGAFLAPRSVRNLGPEGQEVARVLQENVEIIQGAQEGIAWAVEQGRALGMSWNALGWCLGLTGQAVRKRFADE